MLLSRFLACRGPRRRLQLRRMTFRDERGSIDFFSIAFVLLIVLLLIGIPLALAL